MKYKIVDKNDTDYLVVFDKEQGENVVLHPSTREHRTIEGDYVIVDDNHWTLASNNRHKSDIHALRCNCKKCRGVFEEFKDILKDSNTKVVTYNKNKPGDFESKLTNIFESLKK